MGKKNYFVLLCFLFTAAIANNNHENYSLMDDFYMNLHVHKDSVADISDKYMKSVLGYDFSSRYSDSDEEIIDRMLTRRVCTNQDCKATYNTKLHPPVKTVQATLSGKSSKVVF